MHAENAVKIYLHCEPQELHKDDGDGQKYEISHKGDTYTLTINDPKVADSGNYLKVVFIW